MGLSLNHILSQGDIMKSFLPFMTGFMIMIIPMEYQRYKMSQEFNKRMNKMSLTKDI